MVPTPSVVYTHLVAEPHTCGKLSGHHSHQHEETQKGLPKKRKTNIGFVHTSFYKFIITSETINFKIIVFNY